MPCEKRAVAREQSRDEKCHRRSITMHLGTGGKPAASNIISVRRNVLLESSTCMRSPRQSLVHASPVSKYCNRAYLTKRRLDGLPA